MLIISLFNNRECFVSNDDAHTLSSFVKSASRCHPNMRACKVPNNVWDHFIFLRAEEYCKGPHFKTKTFVVCVGRQPESSVWVMNPELQFDSNGQLIPKRDEMFYW